MSDGTITASTMMRGVKGANAKPADGLIDLASEINVAKLRLARFFVIIAAMAMPATE